MEEYLKLQFKDPLWWSRGHPACLLPQRPQFEYLTIGCKERPEMSPGLVVRMPFL